MFEADSDDESKNSEEGPEGSCPVLKEDTESETVSETNNYVQSSGGSH